MGSKSSFIISVLMLPIYLYLFSSYVPKHWLRCTLVYRIIKEFLWPMLRNGLGWRYLLFCFNGLILFVCIIETKVLFRVQDEDIEDLLDYHGFSIKEFGEPYMVKEGPFLNNNDSGTLKCSKLVHLKKSRTMFEDVSSPSLMEPVSSKAVKMISSDKVYEQNHSPVQCNATGNKLVAEEEMDSEPVSSPTKAVPIIPILRDVVIAQQNVHDYQPVALKSLPVNISPAIDSLKSMGDSTDDTVMPSFKLEFRSSFEKSNYSEIKTVPMDIMPVVIDQERLPVFEMDSDADKIVHSPVLVEDLNDADCISTLEDMENNESSQNYQDEEVAKAKLILILRLGFFYQFV